MTKQIYCGYTITPDGDKYIIELDGEVKNVVDTEDTAYFWIDSWIDSGYAGPFDISPHKK